MSVTPPTLPLTLPVANPGLKDLLDFWKTNILMTLNCHAIGTVQGFKQAVTLDGTPNGLYTVDVTINYTRTYYKQQADGSFQATQEPYPPLSDVPAIIMGGGSTALTFPIQQGDQCLLLFNDRDLNNWFAGNRSGPVALPNYHSINDAIALVGFSPVSSYDADHAMLSNGTAKLGVQASGPQVLVGNDLTTLGATLTNLVTALTTLSTVLASAVTLVPTVNTAAAACVTALAAVQVEISSLLE